MQASRKTLFQGVISEEDLNTYNGLDYIESKGAWMSILAKAELLEQGLGSEAFVIYQSIPPYSEYYIDSLINKCIIQ